MKQSNVTLFLVSSKGKAIFAFQCSRLYKLLVFGDFKVNRRESLASLDQVESREHPQIDLNLAVNRLSNEFKELAKLILALVFVEDSPEETLFGLVSNDVNDFTVLGGRKSLPELSIPTELIS